LAEIPGFKISALLPVANLTRDLPLARSRHHATNAVHPTASPHVVFLFVSDGASQIGERFVSRQLPAALDRYLTALPAMSLAPVAPFLSAQPR
jgi:hypothetical protein